MDLDPVPYAIRLVDSSSAEPGRKTWILVNLASAAARQGDCKTASAVLSRTTNPAARVSLIERLIPYCPDARRLVGEARELIRQLPPVTWIEPRTR